MWHRATVILLAIVIGATSLAVGGIEGAQAGAKVPDRIIYPTIPAPADDGTFACLATNPSCGRDSWFEEWDELQSSELVQYQFVGPGLVSERRFAEAIRLLWQAPGGRELLHDAAARGVLIRADSYKRRKGYAYWDPGDREVVINEHFARVSTWMLASVIGHELRHAVDSRAAADYDWTPVECFEAELVAHQFEQVYVRWIATRYGGLPTSKQMKRISKDDLRLYENLAEIAAADDLVEFLGDMYSDQCGVA